MTVAQYSLDHRHQVKDVPLARRRKWVRRLAKLNVEFVPVSGTLPVCSAVVRDMSCGGVRLASIVPVGIRDDDPHAFEVSTRGSRRPPFTRGNWALVHGLCLQ